MYPIHQFQCNHLDFKYNTDQSMCIILILEKLSDPAILTFVLGAQKNRLKRDGPVSIKRDGPVSMTITFFHS